MQARHLLIIGVCAATLFLAGCLAPWPSQGNQTRPSSANNSNGSFSLSILFPPGSGQANFQQVLPTTTCPHLLDCLQEHSNVTCSYYDSVGALSCPGVSETCFINSIDGVSPQGLAGGYWTILVNSRVSQIGSSCLVPAAGDNVTLQITSDPL